MTVFSAIIITMQDLFKILDNRKIFKLVLGLGNQSYEEIKELSKIYALAKADMFDVNPSEEAINAVKAGLNEAKREAGLNPDDFMICISAGLEGDKHVQKALIDTKKCTKCMKCIKKCPQKAIVIKEGCPFVEKEKCIGCEKCKKCGSKAISLSGEGSDLKKTVELANKHNVECVELHISTKKPSIDDIMGDIEYVVKNIKCPLSLCLDRKYFSNEKIKKLINKVKAIQMPFATKFIIQADGVPMSGGDDTYESTLQAVAMAHLVQDFGGYILISGGTNSKTAELAKMCGVKFHGISVGSYAREIVKDWVMEKKKPFEIAVQKAEALVIALKK